MLTDALRVFGSSSKKYGRGFTLVELAIVLVVIAVALSFGTPALIDWIAGCSDSVRRLSPF
jgi:prepilin-type N-terminal cleavage/methylation domain-containing protein